MSGNNLTCPACGKQSDDPVDCSNCGASMTAAPHHGQAAPAPAAAAPSSGPEPTTCPICTLGRPSPAARFCPACRYDYKLRKEYNAPPPPPPEALPDEAEQEAAPAPATAATPVPASAAAPPAAPVAFDALAGIAYDLLVNVDLSLKSPDDPEPTDLRERVFPLDYTDHLIGRRSDKDNIHPEIVLPDAGASKRHARLTREADGTMSLMDVGSMNGTSLNGKLMTANVKYPVTPDDDITLGCWTRLKLRLR